jgi:HEAT repeats
METNLWNALISKYNEGLADPAEVAELEKLIETGQVEITKLHDLHFLNEKIMGMSDITPSMKLDDQFYAALSKEKKLLAKPFGSFSWEMLLNWLPSTSLSVAILIVGLIGGYLINYFQPNKDVKELSAQITDLKEMMMFTLLEKESVTDRLKAVSLTSNLPEVSQRVTDALINVLNNDPNVNVRLATLDALAEYANTPEVRVQLVNSISNQDSPLVQIALADLMVALNEKSSVGQLKKVMEGNATPKEVKKKLKESIDILI